MDGTRSLVSNDELMIYGVVDTYAWEGEGVRAIDVVDSLGKIKAKDEIVVRINSPGGSVTEGIAIFNALRADRRRVIVKVDAMAASIASVIAMAGDEIIMAENASIMIHDPWAMAIGSSGEMRKMADEIDRLKGIILDIYEKRTGLARAEIEALMAAETYFSASDAVERGFADRVDTPLAVAACAPLAKDVLARLLLGPQPIRAAEQPASPAAPAAPQLEDDMSNTTQPAGAQNAAVIDETAVRADAARAERDRVQGIHAAVRNAKLDASVADALVAEGLDLTAAQARVITLWNEKVSKDAGPETRPAVVVSDARDRFVEGATRALSAKAGLDGGERNEFSSLSLRELARASIEASGNRWTGHDVMAMVGHAFTVRNAGMHTTSDFTNILMNVANKAMLKGFGEADETFDKWTATGSLPDFKAQTRIDMGLFPVLSQVNEGGEYTYGTVSDRKEQIALATYGKMFSISRQAIINDDMSVFTRLPSLMGRAAKRTIGNLVYAVLTTNGNLSDGVALFHATHKNLGTGAGSALSADALDAARVAMAKQQDPDSIAAALNIRPRHLIVPVALGGKARVILNSTTNPDNESSTKPNKAAGIVSSLIEDARLDANSATAWYLAADANAVDTIEVAYLNGQQTPVMENRDGWNVDGAEFKIRIDAGVAPLGFRGLYKAAGA